MDLQPGLVDSQLAGCYVMPLCELEKSAPARQGPGLARQHCLCRGEVFLPWISAVLDCGAWLDFPLLRYYVQCPACITVQGSPV